jgi:hypothetical protein
VTWKSPSIAHCLRRDDGGFCQQIKRLIARRIAIGRFEITVDQFSALVTYSDSGRYGVNFQTLFFYTKGSSYTFNETFQDYEPEYVEQYYRYKDSEGRRFKSGDLSAYGLSGGRYQYEWKGHNKLWRCPRSTMERLHKGGKIFYTKNGVARKKDYLDEANGQPVQTLWTDKAVQYLVSWGDEHGLRDTEVRRLLNRIILASSNPGDLVADFLWVPGPVCDPLMISVGWMVNPPVSAPRDQKCFLRSVKPWSRPFAALIP